MLRSIDSGGRDTNMSRPFSKQGKLRVSLEHVQAMRRSNKAALVKTSLGNGSPVVKKDPLQTALGRKQLVSSLDVPKGTFKIASKNKKLSSTRNNNRNLGAFENPLSDEILQSYLNTDNLTLEDQRPEPVARGPSDIRRRKNQSNLFSTRVPI